MTADSWTPRPSPLLLRAEGPVLEDEARRGRTVLALLPDGSFVAMRGEDYLHASPMGCTLGLGVGSWTKSHCPRFHMQTELKPGSGLWRCEDPVLFAWRQKP